MKPNYKTYPFEVSIYGVKYPIIIMASDIDDVYTVISEQSDYNAEQIQSIIPVFSERKDCF